MMPDLLEPRPLLSPPAGGPARGQPRPAPERQTTHGWSLPEAEDQRLDGIDFGSLDFHLGLRELLAAGALFVAVSMAVTAWLISGG
jgi:hypothetical protein